MSKWTLQHLPDHKALMVTMRGAIDASDTAEMAAEALAEGNRIGVRKFLVDDSEMTPVGTTEEFYEMPKTLLEMGAGPHHRTAVVVPPGHPGAEDLRFFETASYNRRLDLRLFGTVEEALAWLGKDELGSECQK